MTKLSIDTPPTVVSTTATGEVSTVEAATIALFGWEDAAAHRDTARIQSRDGAVELHLDVYPAQGEQRGSVIFIGGLSNHALGSGDFEFELSKRGWNVVGLDLRGHARSGGDPGDFTIPQTVSDIADAAAYARDRFGVPVAVMGSSLGGFYALCAANAVDGLAVAVSHWVFLPNVPMTKKDARMRKVALLTERLLPKLKLPTRQAADWSAVAEDPELRQKCFDDPLMTWHYTARSLASGFRYDPPTPLTELQVPQLVVIGDSDKMTPMPYTRKIYDMLQGDKEWITIPGAGHMGGLVEHQDEMLAVVDGYLGRRMPVAAAH